MDYRFKLKILRMARGLEQAEIAGVCHVSPKTVSGWETQRANIPIDCLVMLCNYYKVSISYILDLPDYPVPTETRHLEAIY